MKNRIVSILLALMLALSVGLIGCGGGGAPEVTKYTLTISSTEGGSVTTPGEAISTYDEGEVVNLVATPDEGYHFVNWTGDVGTLADVNDATTTITMNGDYSIKANFSEIPVTYYTLTVAITGNGSTSPIIGPHTYPAGTVVPIIATPASGRRFVNWSGDVNSVAYVNSAITTVTMQGNYEITANFEVIPPVKYSLTITSTPGGSVTTPGQGTFTYDAGAVVSLVATATSGYQFAGWTGDVGTLSCACQSTTITVNGNYSIMANFEVIPVTYYTLTVAVNGSGSTSPAVGQHSYAAGTTVPIIATPVSCHSFVNWTGNVGTIANVNAASTTITINSNYSVMANFEEEEGVTFPDPNLEAAIREAIGKPTGSICHSDLEGLTSLSAGERNIADLTGLEHCIHLTWLVLHRNRISDISALANLTSLTQLYLPSNQISDISALANLTNLTQLVLWTNQISDVSPLANLTKLTRLELSDNQISDISPLANLTNLSRLQLGGLNGGNQIDDISPLTNLTKLVNLWIGSNQISDISPLANLTNLRELMLAGNQISDISPLANAINLEWLELGSNQINDISLLANFTNLKWLDLGLNQIGDISSLANLTKLIYLALWFNQISDSSPLANLTSLNQLNLAYNQISDISPLANLTNLTYLNISYIQISNISPLANLTNLTIFMIGGNQISDISLLANLINLSRLHIYNNQISDVSSLVDNEGLAAGDIVYLGGNPLSSDSLNIYIPQLEARGVEVTDYY